MKNHFFPRNIGNFFDYCCRNVPQIYLINVYYSRAAAALALKMLVPASKQRSHAQLGLLQQRDSQSESETNEQLT